MRASLGLARGVLVKLLPGVTQKWDFWVVPLAMDAILGTPWLRRVYPAIDWGSSGCSRCTRESWFNCIAEQAYPTLRHLSALELKSCQPNVFFMMLHGLVHMGILRGLVSCSLM